jgi:hypothetical protein
MPHPLRTLLRHLWIWPIFILSVVTTGGGFPH